MSSSTLISTEGSPTLSVSATGSATTDSSSASSSSSSSISSSSFLFSDSFTFIPPLRFESVDSQVHSRRFINLPPRDGNTPKKTFVNARTLARERASVSANELIDLEDRQQDCHDDCKHDEPHDHDQE